MTPVTYDPSARPTRAARLFSCSCAARPWNSSHRLCRSRRFHLSTPNPSNANSPKDLWLPLASSLPTSTSLQSNVVLLLHFASRPQVATISWIMDHGIMDYHAHRRLPDLSDTLTFHFGTRSSKPTNDSQLQSIDPQLHTELKVRTDPCRPTRNHQSIIQLRHHHVFHD